MSYNNNNQRQIKPMAPQVLKTMGLKKFLEDNEIVEIEEVYNLQRYQVGEDRDGMIIDLKEKGRDEKIKMVIDIKHGQPSIQQVHDSLYGVGKDCDLKIIMFTGGHNQNDHSVPTADEFAVNSAICMLQESNVGILLCSAFKNTLKVEDHSIYQYWEQVDRTKEVALPTEEQFMRQTFWLVYFDSFNTGFYEAWDTYHDSPGNVKDWGFIIYLDDILKGEIQLYWDEGGVRYEITLSGKRDDFLNANLSFELLYITDMYGIDSLDYEQGNGRPAKLTIRYSDKPFSWLYTADPKQITDFAESMHEDAWGLRWDIEGKAISPKRGPRCG